MLPTEVKLRLRHRLPHPVNTLGVRKVASADSDPFKFYPGEQALVFRVLLARAGKREANEECETRATSPIALSRALRPFMLRSPFKARKIAPILQTILFP